MSVYQQNRVSAAIWPWANGAGGKKSPATLRRRALGQGAVLLLVGGLVFGIFRKAIPAGILTGVGFFFIVCGLISPAAFALVESWLKKFGLGVGAVLTWVVLTVFYYLCFVPARWVLAWRGVDPMHRRPDPKATTYWSPRPPVSDIRRQY